MEILIKVAQFFLSLSILIIVHEMGHFLAAKWFKTRVEKFYLFFNPWFSIFKFKKGETTYGMGWLPLGGYVKIAGMIDESMDKEQMKKPPEPWEFRSKPAWQRLIVMVAGVVFNLILAVVIYIGMLSISGEKYLPAENLKYGIVADSLAQNIGMKTGDKIIAVNDEKIDDFREILVKFTRGAHSVTVKRNGDIVELNVPDDFFGDLISTRGANFIAIRTPFIVDDIRNNSLAENIGIKKGDHIIGINDKETWSFYEFRKEIANYKNKETNIIISRNDEIIELKTKIPEDAILGVYAKPETEILEFATVRYSFFEAIPAGAAKAYNTTVNYIRDLALLFRPEVKASESLGGFITIGGIFSPTWDWHHFWTITAFLSVILAIMNLLPIPALDGGHVMFLLYEIIVGRKPADKFLEYSQMIGMILLFTLLLYVNFNDVLRLFN